MAKMELEENAFQGSDRQTRIRLNHKALAEEWGCRQSVQTVLGGGGDAKGEVAQQQKPKMLSFTNLVT